MRIMLPHLDARRRIRLHDGDEEATRQARWSATPPQRRTVHLAPKYAPVMLVVDAERVINEPARLATFDFPTIAYCVLHQNDRYYSIGAYEVDVDPDQITHDTPMRLMGRNVTSYVYVCLGNDGEVAVREGRLDPIEAFWNTSFYYSYTVGCGIAKRQFVHRGIHFEAQLTPRVVNWFSRVGNPDDNPVPILPRKWP